MWKTLLQFPSLPQKENHVFYYTEEDYKRQLEHCTIYSRPCSSLSYQTVNIASKPGESKKKKRPKNDREPKREWYHNPQGKRDLCASVWDPAKLKYLMKWGQHQWERLGAACLNILFGTRQRRFEAILCLTKFSNEASTPQVTFDHSSSR